MSVVTNALVSFSILENEQERLNQANKSLATFDPHRHQEFVDITNTRTCAYGGFKVWEGGLWMAAFNYVGPHVLKEIIFEHVDWGYLEDVQLLVKGQDDDTLGVYTKDNYK